MSFTGDALKNLSTKLGTLMFIHKEKKNKIEIIILKKIRS